jgi:phosphatidylserine decarboxylase
MGWFEHGSTILLFLPAGLALDPDLAEGDRISAGRRLAVSGDHAPTARTTISISQ